MAAYAIQFRRGNTTQHNSFTGLLGEVTVDTDKKTLVVHDGSTTGGFPLAREGAASVASTGSFTSNVTVGGTLAVTSTASFSDDVSITGDLGMTGHIIPSANITYDLGSTTNMWRDIYVGPGSLYVNGKKVIEDNNGSINFTTDTNETLKIVVPGTSGTLQFSAGSLQLDGEINAITGDITFGDHLDMNSNRIKNVSAPVEGADSANKTYVDSAISSGVSGGTLSFDGTTGDFSGDVTVGGSLTVTGTVTTVNSETIELADNILLLNSNALGTASQSGGIEVERGDDLNVQLLWDETNDRWSVGAEDFKAANFIGNLTGDVTGTVSSLSNHDTDDLAESGTNRYYTPAREAAATAYVDSEISTLSATVAAGSYSDSDVADYLSGTSQVETKTLLPTVAGQSYVGLPNTPYNWVVGNRLVAVEDINIYNPNTGNPIKVIDISGSDQPHVFAWQFRSLRSDGNVQLTPEHGGSVDVDHSKIINVSTPTGNTDATNKSYVDGEISTLSAAVAASAYDDSDVTDHLTNGLGIYADLSGMKNVYAHTYNAAPGNVNINLQPASGGMIKVSNTKITDVATPTGVNDAATKGYVDSADSAIQAAAEAYTDARETAITSAYTSAISTAVAGKDNTDEITEGSTNLYYTDARADARVANATGSNLNLSAKSTSDLSEGSNQYFTDARAVAAVKSALSMTHSGVYVVTAADDTGNTASTHAITAATLGFDLSGNEFYQLFLNRQLLRPTEYTVNGSNGTVTFSADVIATDDEIEAVIYG